MRLITILFLLISSISFTSKAQKMEGEISYERVQHWSKIYARLTYLSIEEKDRVAMTIKNYEEDKQDMKLYFKDDKSFYTKAKQKENDGGWSSSEQEYKVYRDLIGEKRTDILEMFGKVYIVEDSIRAPNWKIMNKIKEINGYMCMMAVTEDTIKDQKITAWFADNIPVSVGPDLYGGLPGMILELDVNDGALVVTATKIEMKAITEDLNVPKKVKGKKINGTQYNTLVSTHIKDSIKSHRNPFWSMPY
ncbi:GLPGLI family protein [Dyadobacter sp. 3J3]|uniref:GLPGLI family protein n=1 Tax=Dyadobacter sp. 3J3 TaxID=2606600 RepID=UPI001357414C|nr:GLPGLI family protein [Dyadobacter sp. 3J3]